MTIWIISEIMAIQLMSCSPLGEQDYHLEADIGFYGGTFAGVIAAKDSRSKKSVVLIAPENRLGGLSTGGLGQTDIGNK